MNGPEHETIVRRAFQCLPAGEPGSLKRLLDQVLSTCMLPDRVAIPLLRGEDGPWRRYFPPKLPRFNFERPQGDFRAMLPASRFYLGRIVSNLKAGETDEAARYLGVYSHYLGDFSQPAHHYELHIGRLLPPPPDMRNCEYHRMIEDVPARVPPLRRRPVVLGATLAETLFRIEGRFSALYDLSVASVAPMVRAIYARRNERAAAVASRVVRETAALLADVCRTLPILAGAPPNASDRRRLAVCDLRLVPPSECDVEFNFGHRPLLDALTPDRWGKAVPLALILSRHGRPKAEALPGICAIPHALPIPGTEMRSMMAWRLPRGVFCRFQANTGLLAGRAPQAKCRFEVALDGRTAWQGPWVTHESLARPVDLDLSGVRDLRLLVHTDGSTDKLAFPIWGTPRLCRAVFRDKP